MNVLVTGSAGFIGSHICDALLEQGHDVTGIDDLSAGHDFTPKGVTPLTTPLEDWGAMDVVPADVIIHAAALADVSRNWQHEDERSNLMSANVDGTYRLLESYANEERLPRVVFLSTCAVYGDTRQASEDTAVVATSPYAASKLAGEALVQAYAHKWGQPWHVLRLGCVVGSRYRHGHVADFVRSAKVGGWVDAKSDGAGKKSFVHISDVVSAVMGCVRREYEAGVYNCVSGTWSPRDTIRLMGYDDRTTWRVGEGSERGWVGDPMAVASNGKLLNAGWRSAYSVENGVREALSDLDWPSRVGG